MTRLLTLLLLATGACAVASEGWMVCYFSSWAVYRPGVGKFDVSDIDPELCTHVIFGFAGLSNQTWAIEVLDPWNENCAEDTPPGNHCAFQHFVALKQKNPKLIALLAVGGWNEGSTDYSTMVADPSKRAHFIQSCIDLVHKEGFDGLDIDWEYPNQRGGVEADKENFITLLDEFRVQFDKYGLLMTAALANGNPTSIGTSYDVAGLVRNLDVLSIMTYDFHGAWETFTHHNSPLCAYPSDEGDFLYFNVEASINYWLEMGASPEKMVMGIPLYGRCFTLDDINNHGMLANASKPGAPGPYTRLPGTQGWNEICVRISDTQDCTVVNDPLLHEPYMYCKKDNLWCGYDDEVSAKLKAQFAKSKGLAGSVFWTIDTDDFQAECSPRRFGVINTVKDVFASTEVLKPFVCGDITTDGTTARQTTPQQSTPQQSTPQQSTPQQSTPQQSTPQQSTPQQSTPQQSTPQQSTPQQSTPQQSTPDRTTPEQKTTQQTFVPSTTTEFNCNTSPDPGDSTDFPVYPSQPDCDANPNTFYYPHSDCNKYWWCVSGEPTLMLCGPGTFYNPATELCDHPDSVDTTHCRVWLCVTDGVKYPGVDCDEYYECVHGAPVEFHCNAGLYYNPTIMQCDFAHNVDHDTCNVASPSKQLKEQE